MTILDVLRQWAICLIIAAAAGTFAMVVSPRGSMDKTIRAVVGIFVVAVICSPLAEMKSSGFSLGAMAEYEFEEENANVQELREQLVSACRDAVEAQAVQAAQELGIGIESVEAEMSVDADNCIIIHNITVNIATDFEEKARLLSESLQEKLGVPVQVNSF